MRLLINNSDFSKYFEKEAHNIYRIIGNRFNVSFYHVGGTALQQSLTQPIIDILVAVKTNFDHFTLKDMLLMEGYSYNQKDSTLRHLVLGKKNSKGEIKYIIHICPVASKSCQDILLTQKILRKKKRKLQNLNIIKFKYKDNPEKYKIYKNRYFSYLIESNKI